jgi:hypothetical protein
MSRIGLLAEGDTRLHNFRKKRGLSAAHVLFGRHRKPAGLKLPGVQNCQLFVSVETAVLNDLTRALVIACRVVDGLCGKAQ